MDLFDKSAPTRLRTTTALTTSLVASDELAVPTHSTVSLEVEYTAGTGGTGVEYLPEVLMAGESVWSPAVSALSAGTPSGGAVTMEACAVTYSQGAGKRTIHIPVYGATRFRVQVKEVGTVSAAGTCGILAVASRLGA
jgi:hypothetical protein